MTYNPAGGKTYTLASSISSTATTITLSSFTLPVSNTPITMAILNSDIVYGTIGPKTSSAEFISFTGITQNANGTATLTGVTRGLDKVSPFTTNATYKLPHSGQTLFILSDAPQVFAEYAAKKNTNTFTALNVFSGFAPQTDTDPVAGNDLTRLSYVQALVLGTLTSIDVVVPGTAGETIVDGNLIYLNTDNKWYKTDADTASTVNNVLLGIAKGAGVLNGQITNGVLLQGVDNAQSGLTGGQVQYASNTAGAISSTPGTVEVTVGVAKSATELYFAPRFNQQITEDQQDALAGSSGTPSSTNKYVTEDDVSSSAASGKIVRATGTALPALGGQNLTNIQTHLRLAGLANQNNTTENTVFTTTITANTLGSNGFIRVRTPVSTTPETSSDTITTRLKFGGSTIATISFTSPAIGGGTAISSYGYVEVFIANNAATNSQNVSFFVSLAPQLGAPTNPVTVTVAPAADTTSAVDTTTDQTLAVTSQKTTGTSSSGEISYGQSLLEVVYK